MFTEHWPDTCALRTERHVTYKSKKYEKRGLLVVRCGQCGKFIGYKPELGFDSKGKPVKATSKKRARRR